MPRTIFLILVGAVGVALCVAGYILGSKITFAAQWPLYEALRNTASIIFAVVGAWLAIVYPERFKLSLGRQGSGNVPAGANMGMLLLPAVHSTILLVVLLLVGLVAPLLKQLPFVVANVEIWRGVSYSLLATLTYWQIIIVVMTLFPAEALQRYTDQQAAVAEIDAQHNKLRQKQK